MSEFYPTDGECISLGFKRVKTESGVVFFKKTLGLNGSMIREQYATVFVHPDKSIGITINLEPMFSIAPKNYEEFKAFLNVLGKGATS